MSIRLSSTPRKWLNIVHLLAIAGVFGGDLALVTLGIAAAGGLDPAIAFPAAHALVQRLLLPMALLTLVSGIALSVATPWGLFKHGWVMLKLFIVLGLTSAIIFILMPGLESAAAGARATGTLARNPLLVGPVGASALVLLALILGVLKPSFRSRKSVNAASNLAG